MLRSAQTDMFAAEYRSDNSSGLHCRVIKVQHQTERLCLSTSRTADSFNYYSAQQSAPQLGHRRRRDEITI